MRQSVLASEQASKREREREREREKERERERERELYQEQYFITRQAGLKTTVNGESEDKRDLSSRFIHTMQIRLRQMFTYAHVTQHAHALTLAHALI